MGEKGKGSGMHSAYCKERKIHPATPKHPGSHRQERVVSAFAELCWTNVKTTFTSACAALRDRLASSPFDRWSSRPRQMEPLHLTRDGFHCRYIFEQL